MIEVKALPGTIEHEEYYVLLTDDGYLKLSCYAYGCLMRQLKTEDPLDPLVKHHLLGLLKEDRP